MIGPARAPGLCQESRAQSFHTARNPEPVHSVDTTFGNDLRTLPSGVGRILLQNPNGLGMKQESFKQHRLKSSIIKHDFGIIGLSETSVNWNRLPHSDGWWSRTHSWFDSLRSSKSFNTTDNTMGRYQAGGTITMTRGRYAHCTDQISFDKRNLGRWSSIRLRGKGAIRTRIVTVYCPCPSSYDHPYSTYNQHLRHLASSNIHRCPRQVFWDDLLADIESWKEAGEQLVIMGDWNHPINEVQDRLAPIGLTDAILNLHPDSHPPATHIRGSKTIDGIFVTATLRPIAGGFCMFNKILLSDHRALWIDIPLVSLLGFSMPLIVQPSARRLKLGDPRVMKKYYDFLDSYLLRHNLYNRAALLLAQTVFPLPPHLAREYELIHDLCTKGMLAAEKQCRQLYRGVHPWSLVYAVAQRKVVYWTICTQKLLGQRVDTKKLIRLGSRLGFKFNPDLSVEESYIEKDRAWEFLKETKGNSLDLRHSFLDTLAAAQAEANNMPKEAALRTLRKQEDQRRASLAIRNVTDRMKSGSTSRVLTTDPHGNPIEITDQVPMERVITKVHEKKVHASEPYCPLMSGQLFDDIGRLGFGPRVKDILDGSYVPPADTPRGTKLFLQHMKQPDLPSPPPVHSLATFRSRWKRTKEKTSSLGPLHFGHYKAGSADNLMGWLLYTLAEIPFISGYSPKAWRHGVDVVILKSANDYRIEKMRTLVLYHPEFNMNNRRLGWEAMNVAISNGQLAIEQYSRPGRSSIDHVVNRQLSFNQFVYARQPFGVCSCDLTGCYDRVVHSAISIAMQRLGFKQGAIQSQFDTIQKLVHKVRTVFGDSNLSYGGNTWKDFFLHPPQGFGQGNCFGPPGWAILSSTIFAILKDQGFGVKFCTALSREIFELCGFAYVDDADLLQVGRTPVEVSTRLQKALTTWEEVINATGGAMAPSKSWWYSIDFVWKHGSFSLCDGGKKGDLIAHDESGSEVSLSYLMHTQATKMLGVWLAPDGNHVQQVAKMKEKALIWADYIRAGHLNPADTWVALSTTIWKTLEYPLPALMLTEDDIRSIVWPVIQIALPKMGMCRNLSTAVRYGPLASGGIGLRDLFLVMGVARIQYLLEHPWKQTPTGSLIKVNWESVTLEAGILGPLLDTPFSLYKHWLLTTDTWVRATLDFISLHNIQLSSSPFAVIPAKRLRDSSIMEGLARVVESPAALRRLNQCRLFLRVVSVADISNVIGTEINHCLFGTSRSLPYRSFRRNNYSWPTQDRPPLKDWTLWRDSIKAAFCSTNWELRTRLGDWLGSQQDYYNDWDYFLQVSSMRLYKYNGSRWGVHQRSPARLHSRTASFLYRSSWCDPPTLTTLRRTTIVAQRASTFSVEYFSLLETTIVPWVDPTTPPDDSLKSLLLFHLRSCKEIKWLASTLIFSVSLDRLLDDWSSGNIISVSDGSFDPIQKAGASAWSVESLDGTQFIRGGGRTAGLLSSQGAYRSELAGLLGISMVLWSLEQCVDNNQRPQHIVGCDGISALFKCMTKNKERLHTRDKHFDIISAIIGFWNNMRAEPFPVHVLGHQDDSIHVDSLPRLARMNVAMDSMAKDILDRSQRAGETAPLPLYTFGLPAIYCHGVRLESCLAHTTVDLISTINLREYWMKKANIPPLKGLLVHWPSFERAFKSLAFSRQVFVRKWLSETIPIGSTLRKRKCGTDNRCPRCRCYTEDPQHCLTCPARDTQTHRLALLNALFHSLRAIDTCPDLLFALESVLPLWLRNPNSFRLPLDDLPGPVLHCFESQARLGWFQFFSGFHVKAFVTYQTAYYSRLRSQRSALLWSSKFIRALWNFTYEMWSHRNLAKHSVNDLATDSPEVTALRAAACAELNMGLAELPPLYRHFFNVTPAKLLAMVNTDLRMWFRSIRLFRESTSTSVVDVFSSPGPFRSWVGLGPPPSPP